MLVAPVRWGMNEASLFSTLDFRHPEYQILLSSVLAENQLDEARSIVRLTNLKLESHYVSHTSRVGTAYDSLKLSDQRQKSDLQQNTSWRMLSKHRVRLETMSPTRPETQMANIPSQGTKPSPRSATRKRLTYSHKQSS